ncbi:DNA methyltransferase [Desulfonatronum thioautotrophicum]|uniref:DNA methyltransferase n=1 Tax=Desulfonatronum thioautotrophicum TaxID=617001 RepID=UPI000A0043FE|nr:DNA methyltransferase [Desulfonatronum thioautotrophicum]
MLQPYVFQDNFKNSSSLAYRERLNFLLSGDLGFHNQNSRYASHNFHSFPAKFPPQLPRLFVSELTAPGDIVLDPMMGSGTTLLEAFLLGRRPVGFDVDPLALLLAKTKMTSLDKDRIAKLGRKIVDQALQAVAIQSTELEEELNQRWDEKSKEFLEYWFAPSSRIELLALVREIEKISEKDVRDFFELAFSAIIITKSGGVSLALDLGHTRPHRAKVVIDQTGQLVAWSNASDALSVRSKKLVKRLRSPIDEFAKRTAQNLKGLQSCRPGQVRLSLFGRSTLPKKQDFRRIDPLIEHGNAQSLPLEANSVDLIVTSPPYASNAIDYMRAHKFSLVWFGHSISELGHLRKGYIGSEATTGFAFENLPTGTARVVEKMSEADRRKGVVLHRYYSEMSRVIREFFRVLKPGKSAIVVVGNSIIRGQDTMIPECLSEIGQSFGFEVPKIGVRNLDRNRRMMPTGTTADLDSRIQQRMHEEFIIGFYKPMG